MVPRFKDVRERLAQMVKVLEDFSKTHNTPSPRRKLGHLLEKRFQLGDKHLNDPD